MIKKIKNIYLKFKDFFISHQPQFLLLLILIVLSDLIPQIPYINKLISFWEVLFSLWVISVIIFKLSDRASAVASVILMTMALFLLILKKEDTIEIIGNLIYFLLLIIFGQSFWQYLKEVKTTRK